MKKGFAILMCVLQIITLSACTPFYPASADADTIENSSIILSEPSSEPVPSPASTPEPVVANLGFTADEFLSIINIENNDVNSNDFFEQYDTIYLDDFDVYSFINNYGIVIMCFSEKNSKEISVVQFSFYKGSSAQERFASSISDIIFDYVDEPIAEALEFQKSEKDYIKVLQVYPTGTTLSINSLPYKVCDIRPDDGFLTDDETMEAIEEAVKLYDFSTIIEMAQNYINVNDPPKDHASYKILELLENFSEYQGLYSVEFDEVEDTAYVFYKDITDISDSTHLVTRLNDGGITLTAGFCDSDWLFFDEVIISLEDQENITHSFDFYEVNREVINYEIKESVAYTPTSEEIEKFTNSSNGIIRFKNSGDEKHLDFQLSTDEIQAANTLFKIKKAEHGLSIYLSWFNQK